MMLLGLLLAPFLAGIASLFVGSHKILPKICAVVGLIVSLAILAIVQQNIDLNQGQENQWLMQWQVPWISAWGISFHLGLDSLAFWLIALSLSVGLIAVVMAEPKNLPGPFFAALLWAIVGVVGIFLSADIFLFFVFWELALLPVYFMLIAHGQNAGFQASLRFILFTQLSGLVLLISVVALAFAHFHITGILTFDYHQIVAVSLSAEVQMYLLMGFLLAFLIKLPAFPVHGWLVGVFMEMPIPSLLVGILIKTAVFGMLRFSWALFPDACLTLASPMMILGAFGIIYGAILAFSQDEPKMVLAYATLSHVGLLLIGVFGHNQSSYAGVVVLMICQAFSTGGLLLLLDRVRDNGGLWTSKSGFSALVLSFVMASIGIPGFGNFVGEWLILNGSFAISPLITVLASLGIVLGALYSLRLFQKIAWQNPQVPKNSSTDLRPLEISVYGFIILALTALGMFPGNILGIFSLTNPTLSKPPPALSVQTAFDEKL